MAQVGGWKLREASFSLMVVVSTCEPKCMAEAKSRRSYGGMPRGRSTRVDVCPSERIA